MAYHAIEIKHYIIDLPSSGGSTGGPAAIIQCVPKLEDECVLSIYFESGPLPANIYNEEGSRPYARMHRPVTEYAWYLDLLRNEGPIFFLLDTDYPTLHILRTTREPVGEGE